MRPCFIRFVRVLCPAPRCATLPQIDAIHLTNRPYCGPPALLWPEYPPIHSIRQSALGQTIAAETRTWQRQGRGLQQTARQVLNFSAVPEGAANQSAKNSAGGPTFLH